MTIAVELRSRIVIATGPSSGIGQAGARRVAACGAGGHGLSQDTRIRHVLRHRFLVAGAVNRGGVPRM